MNTSRSREGSAVECEHFVGKFEEGLVHVGVVGSRHLKEIQPQFFGKGLSLFRCNFLSILMLTLGANEHAIQVAFIVQFFDLLQPLDAALETVLVGAIVDGHHEIWILAHSQRDGLVELVAAEVEEKELDTESLFGEGNDLRVDFCALRLRQMRRYHIVVTGELIVLLRVGLHES